MSRLAVPLFALIAATSVSAQEITTPLKCVEIRSQDALALMLELIPYGGLAKAALPETSYSAYVCLPADMTPAVVSSSLPLIDAALAEPSAE